MKSRVQIPSPAPFKNPIIQATQKGLFTDKLKTIILAYHIVTKPKIDFHTFQVSFYLNNAGGIIAAISNRC
ncbi:MAG: hypothetical protein D5R98_04220 [Desulfonatronovibrio sp. MSAO_Bac4]|nr:MAG: hypothetical protein D5R98_04220 [Desulfonatronovibrio sp. MSAO_Bac4]